jgi:integrase/recombinase XerC
VNFDPFLTYLSSEKRSSIHTVDAYRRDLEQFAAFCLRSFEIHSPEEVTTAVVRTWMAELMEEGYKTTSVHRKLSSVHTFFRYGLRQGFLKTNPVKGISKPKLPQRLPTFIEERGMQRLYPTLEATTTTWEGERNQMIMRLFYETGMRVSELIDIQDRDVDFSIGQVKITGKRNKTRYVPVSPSLLKDLQHYQHSRDQAVQGVTLFVTRSGKKMYRKVVYVLVKSYLSTITTLPKRSPHVLRHTFATHMLNNGADLNVIKEILGHSSLAATQVYTHLSVEKLKGIHEKMHPRNR